MPRPRGVSGIAGTGTAIADHQNCTAMLGRPFVDLRQSIRLPVHGEIVGHSLSTKQTFELRDLGAGGFLAETPTRISLGTTHDIVLSTKEGELAVTLRARCAHIRRRTELPSAVRFGVGFAFVTPNARAIDALLDRLTGSLAFPPETPH
jgi:hypothetical protein